jgi:hypothetical protein
MAKGHFVQGMQHPRIFGQGHIGRGRTNIAKVAIAPCEGGGSRVTFSNLNIFNFILKVRQLKRKLN